MSRDTDEDYRAAMVAEYESYRNAGRTVDAEHVAGELKGRYGYDVEDAHPELDEFTADSPEDAPERADEPGAPENTAVPRPARVAKKAAPPKPPAR